MESNNNSTSKKRGRKKVCKDNVTVPEKKKKEMFPWAVELILEAITENFKDRYNNQLAKWSGDGDKIMISSVDCFIVRFMEKRFKRYKDKNRFANFKHNLNDWRFSCIINPDIDDGILISQLDGFFKRDFPGDWKNLRYGRDRFTHKELEMMNEMKDGVISEQKETIHEQNETIDELRETVAEQEMQNIEKDDIIAQQKMTIERLEKQKEGNPTILTPDELAHVDGVIEFLGSELMANKSSQNSVHESYEFKICSEEKCDTDDEGEQQQTSKPKKEAIVDCDTE